MIIKIIPETEAEKQKYQEVEHSNIKNFFIFGNKRDKDNDLIDFHEWNGQYRYLEGSLYYFLTTIAEERKAKSVNQPEISLQPPLYPKSRINPQFIKKGTIEDTDVQMVNVEEIAQKMQKETEKSKNIVEFPKIPEISKIQNNVDEFVEPSLNNNESKNAED